MKQLSPWWKAWFQRAAWRIPHERRTYWSGFLGLSMVLSWSLLLRAEEATNSAWLTVDRIYGQREFKLEEWGPAVWLKDGTGYTTLEKSSNFKEGQDIVRYQPESGQREILVSASDLIPRGELTPLKIADYAWSDDTRKLLLFTNTKRVWRKESRGDYWVFDRKRGELKKLGGSAPPSTLMYASFSPEGGRVAFVRMNNLYVQDLDSLRMIQLTKDGSERIINGTADWVYEEEFYLRQGYRWSPDGKHIAYWQFDTTLVPQFKLINNTDTLYPEIFSYAYPKVGQTNPSCRVGIVKSRGGRTRWFQPNQNARNHYIPQMEWAKDSRYVVFQQLNRLQNTNQIIQGDSKSGATRVLLTDRDEAWVEVLENWRWIDQGKRFLWLSEQDGWQHLYSVSVTNQQPQLLTPGDYDAISISGVDERRGWVYFVASPNQPTQRYLYRAPLEGHGKVECVSPKEQTGTHVYDMSPDGRWAFHTYSRFNQPPVIELIQLPEHKVLRTLADNSELRTKLAGLRTGSNEFFRVSLTNGPPLDAWCIKPPGFDAGGKYPLLIHVYGEPAGQTVLDRWGGDSYLWHCLLAQQGYVVMSIDNRGTPAPRGREWRKCIYRQIGILASADQAAALRQILVDRPYIDAQRIGIWGWSGGGSMTLNAIFRYPDLYRTAVAIAFVSNQRYYDTIYQERYMGLPDQNEDGYTQGSPITFAHQLRGNLLMVYGTGDDNCHYQNCEALINELVKHNKAFSLLTYPNRTHGIGEGKNTRRHLFESIIRYLRVHLPANVAEGATKQD